MKTAFLIFLAAIILSAGIIYAALRKNRWLIVPAIVEIGGGSTQRTVIRFDNQTGQGWEYISGRGVTYWSKILDTDLPGDFEMWKKDSTLFESLNQTNR